jgi:HNH/ENDO VII superfamily nuclease with conserved GHE residues
VKTSTAKLHALADRRRSADHAAKHSLGHAQHVGMHNKHWWQKLADVVSDVLAKITIVLLVVAVVAIVVLAIVQPELIPGLLVLAGQTLTALSAAQLAVDGSRKAMGENVSWGSLGLDALGALPGVGMMAKGGMLGETGLRITAAISRGGAMLRESAAATRVTEAMAGGKAFARSLGRDLTEVRVGLATTPEGMTMIVRDGKGAGQMLADAKSAATDARDSVRYDRPSDFRKGVRRQVWNSAERDSGDGVVYDPQTGRAMDPGKPWDMGHKPGYEFTKHQESARLRGISRKQFLEEHNNPDHYRPELPSSNRNHASEGPPDVYYGP